MNSKLIASSLVFGLATLMMTTAAFAADTGWKKVTRLRMYASGHEIVYFDSSWTGGTCSEKSAVSVMSVGAGGTPDEWHRTLLAAFLSGKEVLVEFTGTCTGGGTSGRVIASIVDLR